MAETTADLRNGIVLRYNGDLCKVVEWQHVKPGKGGAFVRIKLKNLRTGSVVDDRMRAGEGIDIVRMERRDMQYLYRDGDDLIFMDNETFEQTPIPAASVGDGLQFLKENDNVGLVYTDANELVDVDLPTFVELEVTQTEIAVKGDTATSVNKPATLETGAVITVPGFVNEGDVLKIDTRTGTYIERVR
jgi:elongation factor P